MLLKRRKSKITDYIIRDYKKEKELREEYERKKHFKEKGSSNNNG